MRAKLVMPGFVHRTARPVTDPSTGRVTVDPQLHTHITVPTWVQRPDGSWSQLYSEALYQHAAAAGAVAQAEWRDRLVRELGISTVVDGKGCFSIVGITDAQRREFSRRTQQIEALERQLGIDLRPQGRGGVDAREQARGRPQREPLRPVAGARRGRRARCHQHPDLARPRAGGIAAAPARPGAQHRAARRAWADRPIRDVRPSRRHPRRGRTRAAGDEPGPARGHCRTRSSPTARRCSRWYRTVSRANATPTRSPGGSTPVTSLLHHPGDARHRAGHDRHRPAAIGRVRRCRRRSGN